MTLAKEGSEETAGKIPESEKGLFLVSSDPLWTSAESQMIYYLQGLCGSAIKEV